ncbi:rRNA pseudouridine synthase [Panacibacter ginsenosidivorans]|uniref:Pseudouridine synthase n=1 Tax=Panacibacter ginsenosidivorans TaxID=1813871 RepID=A0A5B8VC85_9BACT|nr:pseudouridine synthase [Panacibacter ginsenosidivorans]QEC69137.1 rRNA pseudouridine synthase [Panacibacter ginsenosidivorans]
MQETGHRYFIINKPANMVSQFISSHNVGLLGDLDFDFPEGIHAIGRLDGNSEGLLILTTNKKVTKLLFQGAVPHKRVYLVQVVNKVSEESLNKLRTGVTIRIKGGEDYITPVCEVSIVESPELLAKQAHALPEYIPVTWLLIILTEGKFRQVRKMVKAIHHKCKRLIRVSIEDLVLGDLEPGCVKEIEEKDFFELLKIDNWQ